MPNIPTPSNIDRTSQILAHGKVKALGNVFTLSLYRKSTIYFITIKRDDGINVENGHRVISIRKNNGDKNRTISSFNLLIDNLNAPCPQHGYETIWGALQLWKRQWLLNTSIGRGKGGAVVAGNISGKDHILFKFENYDDTLPSLLIRKEDGLTRSVELNLIEFKTDELPGYSGHIHDDFTLSHEYYSRFILVKNRILSDPTPKTAAMKWQPGPRKKRPIVKADHSPDGTRLPDGTRGPDRARAAADIDYLISLPPGYGGKGAKTSITKSNVMNFLYKEGPDRLIFDKTAVMSDRQAQNSREKFEAASNRFFHPIHGDQVLADALMPPFQNLVRAAASLSCKNLINGQDGPSLNVRLAPQFFPVGASERGALGLGIINSDEATVHLCSKDDTIWYETISFPGTGNKTFTQVEYIPGLESKRLKAFMLLILGHFKPHNSVRQFLGGKWGPITASNVLRMGNSVYTAGESVSISCSKVSAIDHVSYLRMMNTWLASHYGDIDPQIMAYLLGADSEASLSFDPVSYIAGYLTEKASDYLYDNYLS